jgi:dihydroorotase
MCILIKGGRVIDPYHCDQTADILIEGGRIAAIGPPDEVRHRFESSKIQHPGARIIDAGGHVVCPGLVDMHVHLREPGFEHKETIASGSGAAVCGGFTAVCCMANTHPVNDSPQTTALILEKARTAGMARVYPVAAVTKNLAGKDLVDFDGLKRAGAIAFSDDGNPVTDAETMRAAMHRIAELGMPVISHCEEPDLVGGGAMNAGPTAEVLGIKGIPNISESVMVARDIALSEQTGAPVHIAHVSTRESIAAIRQAKDKGVPVTAETAPHYFCLTDEAVKRCGANAKMNPPLRSKEDLLAIRQALADHTIDAIATDHAPHSPDEKALPFEQAPNGIIGLETALGLSLQLVEDGILTLDQLIAKWTHAPSRILGLSCGLDVGMPADLLIFDPDYPYAVDAAQFRSKSRNTPFDGWQLRGKALMTIVAGRIVYEMR